MTRRINNYEKHQKLIAKVLDAVKNSDSGITVRELARRFHVKQFEILLVCDDCDELEPAVGIKVGSGYFEFESVGDYIVEYYGE